MVRVPALPKPRFKAALNGSAASRNSAQSYNLNDAMTAKACQYRIAHPWTDQILRSSPREIDCVTRGSEHVGSKNRSFHIQPSRSFCLMLTADGEENKEDIAASRLQSVDS